MRRRASLAVFAAALAGCAAVLPAGIGGSAAALRKATDAGFQQEIVEAGDFNLLTLQRLAPEASILHVYIEGDGRAFLTRTRPSADPTPRQPVALELALRDPAPSVVYLARPCQYLPSERRHGCSSQYWTTARYADPIVCAMNHAIDTVVKRAGASAVGLVGYSGGGTVAALIAARRNDVAWLVTVAANLDHAAWTGAHGVTPLAGSLNPVDFAERLRDLPQLHLRGGRDGIVPASVTESYLAKLGHPPAARVETYADFDHDCCWPEIWPRPLSRLPSAAADR